MSSLHRTFFNKGVIMPKPPIKSNDVALDIRNGMDDGELMKKYELSPTQLATVFTRLIEAKRVTQAEMDTRCLLEIEPLHAGICLNSALEGDNRSGAKGVLKYLNDRQRIIVVGGVILFVLMTLSPPWKYTWTNVSQYSDQPAVYGLIFLPPISLLRGNASNVGIKIDIVRLVLQWLILTAVTICGVFIWPGPGESAPPKKPDLGGRKHSP
jgi:hypothetical protein